MTAPTSRRLYIAPEFKNDDKGDGGVRRVVEAQRRYLPSLGFDIVGDPRDADIIACHAGSWIPRAVNPNAVRVVHCHGLYWDEPQYSWWAGARERNPQIIDTFRKADVVVSPAEWVASIFRRDLWLQTEVLYNGIELPAVTKGTIPKGTISKSDSPPSRYVLWNKARVDPVCEVDSLGKLVERMTDVEFVSTFAPKQYMDIAAGQGGSGPWKVAENLTLTGRLPFNEAIKYVDRAGIYLCTTREVFSVGLLEAMARGVPVVGYAWGGQREVIRHKIDGWLATPNDTDGLAAGIEYVLAHWDEMSQAATERAQDFTWRAQMVKCADIYSRALAEYGPRPNTPKVSVVIPCHNLEKFVGAAIDSAIGQKVAGGHEVIVVDDASTDDSWDAIQNFPLSTQLRAIQNPRNLYLAGTLDEGIRQARGKYILNLDADNILPPGALDRLATALDDDESVDAVYGRVKFVAEDGVTPGHGVGPDGFPKPPWPPEQFDYGMQMSHRNQVQSSAMFRKKVWERALGYRQHVAPRLDHHGKVVVGGGLARLNSDADFWCRAATLGFKFKHIGPAAGATLIYRQRVGSMSSTVQDYDWTAWCPNQKTGARIPMGVSNKVITLEPIAVTVIVDADAGSSGGLAPWMTLESLWPQTFDHWECIVVSSEKLDVPPYVKYAGSFEEAVGVARGSYVLPLTAGDGYLHPEALSLLLGGVQWSLTAHRDDMRSRFAYSDWVDLQTAEQRLAVDSRVGAVLLPKSWAFLGAHSGAGAPGSSALGALNWHSAAIRAGLCGQYVAGPLLVGVGGDPGKGERELAGCGCGGRKSASPGGAKGCVGPGCLSRGARTRTAPEDAKALAVRSRTGEVTAGRMILLRYVGVGGSRSFIGSEGRRYIFGTDVGHREKYVYEVDVSRLLGTGVLERVVLGSPVTPIPLGSDAELVGA